MLFAVVALAAPVRAAEVVQPKRPVRTPNIEMMQTYYLVLLYRGDRAEKIPPDSAQAIQAGHLANMIRLHDEKKMPLAGPFLDDTDLQGIFILNAASMEEAKQLCDTDPAIQAGRLRAEIHPWYAARGIRTVYDDKYKLKPDTGGQ
jgi:uncharacterized protein YciI